MHRVRKHITPVVVAFVFAPDGKRLARRATRNQLDPILPLCEVHMPHILVKEVKFMTHRAMPVLRKGIARVLIALNYCDRLKPRLV